MNTGPAEDLDQTENAQRAVLAVDCAQARGLSHASLAMGHSLGEYAALVAAGVLSYAAACELVAVRARCMAEAGRLADGGMAAVLGLGLSAVEAVVAGLEDVYVANVNGDNQIVIAGRKAAVQAAEAPLKEAGAKRCVALKVSVASHCPLMEPARLKLAEQLQTVALHEPRMPVIFNVTADTEDRPEAIRELLSAQLVSPVRWTASVAKAIELGIDSFIECGPQSVLSALIRRQAPTVQVETRTVK
ncbi:MAG: Malonyl CoA-acyl carrier protein transacylase [Deltaproteobacteria bacterium ADurb.Bin510]|nr:MAG: Malonyl CoA-acyl carrier protein transacylase [Deltaproteobacteria bacterium ADurb.Bin510]